MWWLAAACVAALSVGWLWLIHQSASEPTVAVAHKTSPKTQAPAQERSGSTRADAPDRLKRVASGAGRPHPDLHTHITQKTKLELVTTAPVATSTALPTPDDVSALVETPAVVDKFPASAVPKVARVKPKRRFQVVHENELRAEEEAQPKLYRPDHFVRLGSGQVEEPRPEAGRPALIMSLTNKPNQ
ncbi:hypothetical protein GCM10028818_12880 [Spirosoma horti]